MWRILDGGGLETTVVTTRTFRLERASDTSATVYVNDAPVARDVAFDGTESRANEILNVYRRGV
ncbi:MAG: hypothetical protein VW405_03820 [Rhodospirillaceae bacterium]